MANLQLPLNQDHEGKIINVVFEMHMNLLQVLSDNDY